MLRRLFTFASALSLVVCGLSLVLAIWTTSGTSNYMVARHGKLWSFARTGRGDVSLITMPWPYDEPLMRADPSNGYIYAVKELGHRDAWLVLQHTFAGMIDPKTFGPWAKPVSAATIAVRFKATYFHLWRMTFVLAILPLTLVVLRLLRHRRTPKGFDVEPVGVVRFERSGI